MSSQQLPDFGGEGWPMCATVSRIVMPMHITIPSPTWLVAWRMVTSLRRMNEVNPRRTQLVPGWVTVFGRAYHISVQPAN